MQRVINEAAIWPPTSARRRRRRPTTRTERLLRLLQRAIPSRDPCDWGALADAASREIAAQSPKWEWRPCPPFKAPAMLHMLIWRLTRRVGKANAPTATTGTELEKG
jgi:hypothetical protein